MSPQASAQDADRQIILGRFNIQDPVKIVTVLVNGAPIKNGARFQANGDWIKSILVVVENRSQKALTCVRLGVEFPESRDQSDPTAPLVMTTATAGLIPEQQLYTKSGQKINVVQEPPISIGPGQTISIPIAPSVALVTSIIESSRPISTLTKCTIWIQAAFFSDSTRWNAGGGFFRPDAAVPGKYNRMTKEEFDGSSAPAPK